MLAVVIHQFGDPKQLNVEDVPTPQPHGDEVLVAVHAASINPSDVKNVQGAMHGTTLPRIPGRDFAGVVVQGRPDLVGKEVWGTGGDIGFTRDGTHAQFILLPRAAAAPKPEALSMEAAGAAGVTFVTAWSAMVRAANMGRNDTAAIVGAAGGVGSAALQIAKARGARVIGIVRLDQDIDTAKGLGADIVINSSKADVVKTVLDATSGHGANVVFDTSGLNFAQATEMIALEGRLPVITAPKDGMVSLNLRTVYRKMLRIQGVDSRPLDAVASAAILAEIAPYFQSGQFRVSPVESRPLEDAPSAYAEAAQGGRRIVLRPGSWIMQSI
ncbi:MAG TPA: zinc-binding alcohol dehydrogenase family protein [Tepidisphaeraceae bacterium]|nr:zinc-binding alcohol dehydrogenase family protein [Tepidisphaeraceae bacterium]